MPYFRNGHETSRASFHALLRADLSDPETGEILKGEFEDAMRDLINGEKISAGQHYRTMSTYQIINAEQKSLNQPARVDKSR